MRAVFEMAMDSPRGSPETETLISKYLLMDVGFLGAINTTDGGARLYFDVGSQTSEGDIPDINPDDLAFCRAIALNSSDWCPFGWRLVIAPEALLRCLDRGLPSDGN